MAAKSTRKGKTGEREWAEFLRDNGFTDARRGQQFSGGNDSPDVVCVSMPLFHAEVKRVEMLQLYQAVAQAHEDAAPGKIPYVAHRRNNKQWVVVLDAKLFLDLVKTAHPGADTLPDAGPATSV
jgi:Holliday junction resolvase